MQQEIVTTPLSVKPFDFCFGRPARSAPKHTRTGIIAPERLARAPRPGDALLRRLHGQGHFATIAFPLHTIIEMTPFARSACLLCLVLPFSVVAADDDCLIEARQQVDLRSPVEAVDETVQVQRGDSVKKGQVVATLESGPERAALDLAKSRAGMSGELKSAEARVELTQKKQVCAEELYKQNFVSVNARDEAEADYRLSMEQLRQAKENQKLAELEMQRAAEILAMRTIRSPLSGIVVEVMLKPGEFSSSNLKEPILKLAEVDPLQRLFKILRTNS